MKKFDIVIIGAGITGLFAAEILKSTNQSICIMSQSDNGPMRHKYKVSPNIEYDHYEGAGGGSHLWANVCRPYDKNDYLKNSDLSLYPSKEAYAAAMKFLNVEEGHLFWNSNESPIIKSESIWKEFFQNKVQFLNFIYPNKIKKFSLSKTLYTNEKINDNFLKKYIENVEVNWIDESSEVLKIYYKKNPKSSSDESIIQAKRVILTAGSVGSSKIIYRSIVNGGLNKMDESAKNNVGKNIHEHFMFTMGQLKFEKKMPNLKARKIGSGNLKQAIKLNNDMLVNHSMYCLPSMSKGNTEKSDRLRQKLLSIQNQIIRSPMSILKLILHPNVLFQAIDNKFFQFEGSKLYDLWTVIQSDPSDSRFIDFSNIDSDPVINLSINDNDISNINSIINSLNNLELPGVKFLHGNINKIAKSAGLAAHLGGSLRLSSTPKDGCVDKNYNIFGSSSIFVGDASLIPVSGTSNSTLTACAYCWQAVHSLLDNINK